MLRGATLAAQRQPVRCWWVGKPPAACRPRSVPSGSGTCDWHSCGCSAIVPPCSAPPHPTLQGSGLEHLPLGAPQRLPGSLEGVPPDQLLPCRGQGGLCALRACLVFPPELQSPEMGLGQDPLTQERLEPLWS